MTKHTLAKWAVTGAMVLAAPFALAQAASTTGSTTSPGTPNTGAGGNAAQTLALLGVSAAAVLGAAAYLASRRYA